MYLFTSNTHVWRERKRDWAMMKFGAFGVYEFRLVWDEENTN